MLLVREQYSAVLSFSITVVGTSASAFNASRSMTMSSTCTTWAYTNSSTIPRRIMAMVDQQVRSILVGLITPAETSSNNNLPP